jgi:hypothetical protein
MEDEDLSIQSACSLYIYQGACSVLDLPDIEARRAALARLPALIRPHIEAEIRKLWEGRKAQNID